MPEAWRVPSFEPVGIREVEASPGVVRLAGRVVRAPEHREVLRPGLRVDPDRTGVQGFCKKKKSKIIMRYVFQNSYHTSFPRTYKYFLSIDFTFSKSLLTFEWCAQTYTREIIYKNIYAYINSICFGGLARFCFIVIFDMMRGLLVLSLLTLARCQEDPVATVTLSDLGTISGRIHSTVGGLPYYQFRNIPFAESTGEEQRFKVLFSSRFRAWHLSEKIS